MSEYADHIAFRQITIEIPVDQLLSCIWYGDGSGASGIAGVQIDETPDAFDISSIQTLGDRPDIVRITLVPKGEN